MGIVERTATINKYHNANLTIHTVFKLIMLLREYKASYKQFSKSIETKGTKYYEYYMRKYESLELNAVALGITISKPPRKLGDIKQDMLVALLHNEVTDHIQIDSIFHHMGFKEVSEKARNPISKAKAVVEAQRAHESEIPWETESTELPVDLTPEELEYYNSEEYQHRYNYEPTEEQYEQDMINYYDSQL